MTGSCWYTEWFHRVILTLITAETVIRNLLRINLVPILYAKQKNSSDILWCCSFLVVYGQRAHPRILNGSSPGAMQNRIWMIQMVNSSSSFTKWFSSKAKFKCIRESNFVAHQQPWVWIRSPSWQTSYRLGWEGWRNPHNHLLPCEASHAATDDGWQCC